MTPWRRKYERVARHPGFCVICQSDIVAGDHIAWAPGRVADHWKCFMGAVAERRGSYEAPLPKREPLSTRPKAAGHSAQAYRDLEAVERARSSP